MTLPKTVVVATDFSLPARRAARRAALLAKEHQLPLILLHASDVDRLTALTAWIKGKTNIQEALAEQARIELSVAAHEVRQQVEVSTGTALCEGAPLTELSAAADRAGMLVAGASGYHAIRDLAVGTTTDRVLRKTRAPMLVVKSEPEGPYRRVLVLVDFSPASQAALAFALELAPRATFKLLHTLELPYEGQLFRAGVANDEVHALLLTERQQAHDQFRQLLHQLGPNSQRVITTSVEQGDVRQRALHAAKELAADLIVVGKQGRSPIEDLFLGSVTRTVLAEADCDVLVAPELVSPAVGKNG